MQLVDKKGSTEGMLTPKLRIGRANRIRVHAPKIGVHLIAGGTVLSGITKDMGWLRCYLERRGGVEDEFRGPCLPIYKPRVICYSLLP